MDYYHSKRMRGRRTLSNLTLRVTVNHNFKTGISFSLFVILHASVKWVRKRYQLGILGMKRSTYRLESLVKAPIRIRVGGQDLIAANRILPARSRYCGCEQDVPAHMR